MRFIGVDLHTTQFTVCYLESSSGCEILKTFRMYEMDKFKATLQQEDLVAVETTLNSYYFINQIISLVKDVKEINTFQFKVIAQSVKKTDKNDARLIAHFLQAGLLPEVRKKGLLEKELLSLAQTRDFLVKERTAMINKIHALLYSHGFKAKRESLMYEKNLQPILDLDFGELAKVQAEVLIEQILALNSSIKKIEKKLSEKGKELKGYENIMSIKGVGSNSAVILLSVIGNIEDFENENKLASYLGLVPSVRNSADTKSSGKITRRGNKLARTALVQCAFVVIRFSPYFRKAYNKLKLKKPTGKAIVALARKLLNLIYHILKNNWIIEDFESFKVKVA